jgi:hypothetical protein
MNLKNFAAFSACTKVFESGFKASKVYLGSITAQSAVTLFELLI